MNESNTEQPEREKRMFWAVTDQGVDFVEGYRCTPRGEQPKDDDYWWCPRAGYSGSIGYQLFTNERDALEKAIAKHEKVSADALRIALKLSVRLKTLEKGTP